jgi:hypothetical protein
MAPGPRRAGRRDRAVVVRFVERLRDDELFGRALLPDVLDRDRVAVRAAMRATVPATSLQPQQSRR